MSFDGKGPATKPSSASASTEVASNFIRDLIEADRAAGLHGGRVVTRFPPEPNGYPHIGHAKSIALNFGLAAAFDGVCHLRFDDTNPSTEDQEYVDAIQRDVRWLGFDWGDKLFFASDYYERLYEYAEQLITSGKAYVCSLSEEEFRACRGAVGEPGRPSPYRERSVDENLDLFRRMRAGEFADGAHVLRGKIDMASPNMKMRDWPFYRIRHAHHYRRGDAWCVYPLYDFAHCLSDLIEGITHSICTLEFENNRELYDWILDAVGAPRDARPHQYEFARLNLSSTVMSKRKLLDLVTRGVVDGWDDPRMPTISGLRRRGTTPEAIRAFCERIGVAKNNSTVELELFEHVLREDLDARSPRFMAVLRPLRVVVDNLPEGHVETIEAPLWPEALAPAAGGPTSRPLPFSRHLLIERDDFSASPPPDFFRLAPGREVRLRHAYVARCTSFELDPSTGEPTVVHVELDLESKGAPRKTKGTLHWVSEPHAGTAEVRLYDRLFEGDDDTSEVSSRSLELIAARVEPALLEHAAGAHVQLERLGFFFTDPKLSCPGAPVFGRTVGLKDAWARATARAKEPRPSAPEGSPSAVEGPDAKKPDAKKPDAKKPDAKKPEAKAAPEAEPLSPEARALVLAHGLPEAEARRLTEPGAHAAELARLFEAARGHGGAPRALSKWLVNEVSHRGRVAGLEKLTPAALAGLVELAESGALSAAQAREVLGLLLTSGGDPREIMAARGLGQITDDAALVAVIDAVLAEADELVARYRGGQTSLLGALVGQVMRKAGGKAPAKRVGELLKERLG